MVVATTGAGKSSGKRGWHTRKRHNAERQSPQQESGQGEGSAMSGKSQWLPSKGDARVIKAVAPLHPAPPPPFMSNPSRSSVGPQGPQGQHYASPSPCAHSPSPHCMERHPHPPPQMTPARRGSSFHEQPSVGNTHPRGGGVGVAILPMVSAPPSCEARRATTARGRGGGGGEIPASTRRHRRGVGSGCSRSARLIPSPPTSRVIDDGRGASAPAAEEHFSSFHSRPRATMETQRAHQILGGISRAVTRRCQQPEAP